MDGVVKKSTAESEVSDLNPTGCLARGFTQKNAVLMYFYI
jgi:hypothetical protein